MAMGALTAKAILIGGAALRLAGGLAIHDGECPVLDSWVVSPLRTTVNGGAIDVSAHARAAGALHFQWTAGRGRFTNAAAPTTKYFCTSAGDDDVTVTVTSDNVSQCVAQKSIRVTCADAAK